jgi:hypothetical protein
LKHQTWTRRFQKKIKINLRKKLEMEKNKMQPGLKTSKGKMKDYWLDGDKRNYDNDLLEGFLFAKFGFPGLSGEPLNTQQQAERGYATLEPKSKVHLRKPD